MALNVSVAMRYSTKIKTMQKNFDSGKAVGMSVALILLTDTIIIFRIKIVLNWNVVDFLHIKSYT